MEGILTAQMIGSSCHRAADFKTHFKANLFEARKASSKLASKEIQGTMGYEIALNRAWDEIEELAPTSKHTVAFLTDTYEVRVSDRLILLVPSGTPAGEDVAVLILHYLIGIQRHGYQRTGEWISFKDIWGGESFFPAYRKSTIEPLIEGLQRDPERLLRTLIDRFRGKIVDGGGDVAVELEAFPDVFVRILMWRGDEELLPEAIILFDRALTDILASEDIAALLYFLVCKLLSACERNGLQSVRGYAQKRTDGAN